MRNAAAHSVPSPTVSDAPVRAERRSDALLYFAAAVTYIAASMYEKFLLNWIIGPLWLVAFVVIVPAIGRAFARLRTRRRDGAA